MIDPISIIIAAGAALGVFFIFIGLWWDFEEGRDASAWPTEYTNND